MRATKTSRKCCWNCRRSKAGDKKDKKEPAEKPPSESVGTREATSLDDAIKVFNEKYADNPFCPVQPKLSPFEVTGAIRLALDRETSADLPASELAQLRSIAEKRIVPAGWQFEIYTVTQHVTDETFLQTSIGLTLIRSDGTASIHEIRRLLNEPADGTEDGRTRVLGLYDVGHMPLWTQDGKKQHAGLLIRYLKTHIDPSSWENGTTTRRSRRRETELSTRRSTTHPQESARDRQNAREHGFPD